MSRIIKTFFGFAILGCLVTACGLSEAQSDHHKIYFDLKQFIENQSNMLQKQNPKVQKNIVSDSISTTKKLYIKSWNAELKPFSECDINAPILRDAYEIEETSNQTVYTAKRNDLKVRKITLEKSADQIQAIRIQYESENNFYHTERWAEMELEDGQVYRYSISGMQKILLKNRNSYKISGEILSK